MRQRARPTIAEEVRRFIATGASDPLFLAWEGRNASDLRPPEETAHGARGRHGRRRGKRS